MLQINAGQVEQAEQLLNGILASNPSDLSALVARGTARALARKLKEAVADFSKAIEIEPR
jgi:Flp pilus assembly protein TadD